MRTLQLRVVTIERSSSKWIEVPVGQDVIVYEKAHERYATIKAEDLKRNHEYIVLDGEKHIVWEMNETH